MGFFLGLGIFICGGAGAWLRFRTDALVKGALSTRGVELPLGTLSINLSGSFLLGLLTEASLQLAFYLGGDSAQSLTLLLGTGFLGGFTTFSTAMVELVGALRQRRAFRLVLLGLVQPLACIALAAGGMSLL